MQQSIVINSNMMSTTTRGRNRKSELPRQEDDAAAAANRDSPSSSSSSAKKPTAKKAKIVAQANHHHHPELQEAQLASADAGASPKGTAGVDGNAVRTNARAARLVVVNKSPTTTQEEGPRHDDDAQQDRRVDVSRQQRRSLWLMLRDWFQGASGGWSCHIAGARAIAAMVLPRTSPDKEEQCSNKRKRRLQTLRVEVAGSGVPLISAFPCSSSTTAGELRDAVADVLVRKPTYDPWQTFGLYVGHSYSSESKLSPTSRMLDVRGIAGDGDGTGMVVSVIIHVRTAAKALAACPWADELGWTAGVPLGSWTGVTVTGEGQIRELELNWKSLSG